MAQQQPESGEWARAGWGQRALRGVLTEAPALGLFAQPFLDFAPVDLEDVRRV